ncbi:MAG: glycosyltransferase family 2 protein [Pseudomonadota bacterium]
MANPRIAIVSVSYNSARILPQMLDTVPNTYDVVLVDNGGGDTPDLQALQAKYDFKLIRSETNLGFGGACNLGARHVDQPLILFLNPDATLDPATLPALEQAALDHPDAAAFNPLIIKDGGRIKIKRKSRLVPRHVMKAARDLPLDRDVDMPVLLGSALMVRRDAFEDVGGFDENIFLYFEDDDLSIRLKTEKGRLVRVAGAKIYHDGGQSSGSTVAIQKLKNYEWGRARVYTTRKHGRPFAFLAALLEGVKALIKPTRFGERQSLPVRMALLAGVLSTLHDGGARGDTRPETLA